jgi:hypothetical protein
MSGIANITGGEDISRAFRQLESLLGANGRGQVLGLMGTFMAQQVGEAFDQQKDMISGARWPDLSPQTLRREGRGSQAKALRDTGGLQRAVMSMQPTVSGDIVSIGLGAMGSTRPRGGTLALNDIAAIHNGPLTGAQRGPLVIRPRQAKLLAFPVSREAYRTGSAKDFVRQKRSAGRTIRSGVNSQTGEWGIFEVRGRREVQHYLYARQVRLPGRRFMGFGPRQEADLLALLMLNVNEVLDGTSTLIQAA